MAPVTLEVHERRVILVFRIVNAKAATFIYLFFYLCIYILIRSGMRNFLLFFQNASFKLFYVLKINRFKFHFYYFFLVMCKHGLKSGG